MDRHLQKLARVRQGNCDLLFIGDSITQSYEKIGHDPNTMFYPTWEFFYGMRQAINLGFARDETEHVLWRLDHGEVDGIQPKVAVLLIGTNNTLNHRDWTTGQTLAGIEAIVADLHRRLPRTKLLIIGILPSDLGPDKTAKDQEINEGLKHDFAGSRFATVLDISPTFYKDGKLDTTLFFDTRSTPPHGALHPDTRGQAMMAAAIEPVLSKLLGDSNRLRFHPNPIDMAKFWRMLTELTQ